MGSNKDYICLTRAQGEIEICEIQENGYALPVIFVDTKLDQWSSRRKKTAGLRFIRDICDILNTSDIAMEKKLQDAVLSLNDLDCSFSQSRVDMLEAQANTSFVFPVIFSDADPEDEEKFFHVLDFYAGDTHQRYKVASLYFPDRFYNKLDNGFAGLMERYVAHKTNSVSELVQQLTITSKSKYTQNDRRARRKPRPGNNPQ